MCLTVVRRPYGQEQITAIDREYIEVLRDRKSSVPNAANERLKILGQIFKLAVPKLLPVNPVLGVERLRTQEGGHETATDEHIAQYFAFHKEGPAWLAMKILTETGVRVSDLRILGRQHMRDGSLVFDTVKTGVRCILPIGIDLYNALPKAGGDQLTFLLNDLGQAFKNDKILSQRVSKWFKQAGIYGITAHSVRKWLATRMANNEATEYMLMAWFGWKDPKEARPYIQTANRQELAKSAAAKISNVERF